MRYSAGLLIVLLFTSYLFQACDPGMFLPVSDYATIKGVVMNTSGETLQGVTITIDPWRNPVTTDKSGSYAFYDLGQGTYTVTASLPGYHVESRTFYIRRGKVTQNDIIMNKVTSGITFSWSELPGGVFAMGDIYQEGDADELPVHPVRLSPFSISTFEITYIQYDEFCQQTGRPLPRDNGIRGARPVVNITWLDADAFCKWISFHQGIVVRLPTEAEWEYAARSGGDSTRYSGTNETAQLMNYAWYLDNSGGKIYPVQGKFSNRLGIADMSGNVWEWVQDSYSASYYQECLDSAEVTNPRGPVSGVYKILRGGSYRSSAANCRVFNRQNMNPDYYSHDIGFRVVKSN